MDTIIHTPQLRDGEEGIRFIERKTALGSYVLNTQTSIQNGGRTATSYIELLGPQVPYSPLPQNRCSIAPELSAILENVLESRASAMALSSRSCRIGSPIDICCIRDARAS